MLLTSSPQKMDELEFILPLIVLLHPAQKWPKTLYSHKFRAELQAMLLYVIQKKIFLQQKGTTPKAWFAEDFGSKKERLEWLSKQTGLELTQARVRILNTIGA